MVNKGYHIESQLLTTRSARLHLQHLTVTTADWMLLWRRVHFAKRLWRFIVNTNLCKKIHKRPFSGDILCQLVPKNNAGEIDAGSLGAGCPSWHPTDSVKAMNETQDIDLNLAKSPIWNHPFSYPLTGSCVYANTQPPVSGNINKRSKT